MKSCKAPKVINRWLVDHGRQPIDRKQSYELFAQEVIKRFGLDPDTWIRNKHEAKAFVRFVAVNLEGGISGVRGLSWAQPQEKAA